MNTCDDDYIDFTDTPILQEHTLIQPKYDIATTEKYRVLRKIKYDPITYTELTPDIAFQFPYKWDPYTGERKELDIDGPLYFDPDILIKHFHTKRLDKLWKEPIDEQGGYYSGYYDDAVGLGEDFNFTGRGGSHPEWYLFRLPIIDCYLTIDHNKQFITLGPKLTNNEIKQIDELANLRPDNYFKLFGCKRPSLTLIKQLYDNAISQNPKMLDKYIINKNNTTQEINDNLNRKYVDALKKISG